MAATLNTTQFLLSAAREAMSGLRRGNGDRAEALRQFLAAETNDDRDNVVAEYGSALVRKALLVAAKSTKDEETANVFMTLRDSVDEDGFLDFDDTTGDDDVIEQEVKKFNDALATAS